MASSSGFDDGQVFRRLQALLVSVDDLSGFLVSVARVAASVLGDSTACGITFRYDGNMLTVASSDERAEMLDETQYRTQDGPCLEAARTGRIVEVPDARQEGRWPDYVQIAVEAGVRCSVSLPMTLGADTFGALNVYGFDRSHQFDDAERRRLEILTAQAAGTLRVGALRIDDGTLLRQMEEALASRTLIDQALGIIIAQQRCTATVAFDLLRAESQRTHRRVRDVAADLIGRTSGQPPETGPAFDRT
ncbi:GAF domain-containing protein [Microlunatus sagamiharensis]|uniref:GAF domain-containing protein n=1 Tax=Microlunatus sagamiharensis TaxID=546874 RepID=A0A1H2LZW6_9ACTN|nr:GAF domain-containing protein [Microlunatus sagamiharensis]